MSKNEIKQKIKEAIDNDFLKDEVKKIMLFGSYLHGDFKEDSDIDLLIEFSPNSHIGFFKLVEIQNKLSQAAGRRVDLLTPEALSKYFRDDVLAEAEVIYEK
ncbi:MAG: hypothetical protein A2174_01505 [Candidatus Portnoybacteria bacterium RBG_13_41_18]|uniref:Polymerase beta nucleotidyltransferase domain-containing protein n=1 Tax=Candidatus Portnoybacteria bacterium RBG_13_41_18 TaxID=1801991 RepID=A0A1G2F8M8_9BACT|nr:MAG: hypothetical protein A2174_01505 [Candidatus Portnoybacteria bacterium RBG_13_41_18]